MKIKEKLKEKATEAKEVIVRNEDKIRSGVKYGLGALVGGICTCIGFKLGINYTIDALLEFDKALKENNVNIENCNSEK